MYNLYRYLFLTGLVLMAGVAPVGAAPTNTANSWTGTMAPDTLYENAAVYDNTGVYEGSVSAQAYYMWDYYDVSPGSYWPGQTEWGVVPETEPVGTTWADFTTCPENSYCTGVNNVHYETFNQGLNACSDLRGNNNEVYPYSDSGASLATQCYRACADVNVIEHALAVSGRDYYGAGIDTCGATSCENGYHVFAGYGQIGNTTGTYTAWVDGNGVFTEWGPNGVLSLLDGDNGSSHGQAYYGMASNNAFAVEYATGLLTGRAVCTHENGDNNEDTWTNPTSFATLTDETGANSAINCYCKIDGWTPAGETKQVLNAGYVFYMQYRDSDWCGLGCAQGCAQIMRGSEAQNLEYRAAVSGMVQTPGWNMEPSICVANLIKIQWRGADSSSISENNAGMTVYAGDVRTPVVAQHETGKSFVGWKFLKQNAQTGDWEPVQGTVPEGAMPYSGEVSDEVLELLQ